MLYALIGAEIVALAGFVCALHRPAWLASAFGVIAFFALVSIGIQLINMREIGR